MTWVLSHPPPHGQVGRAASTTDGSDTSCIRQGQVAQTIHTHPSSTVICHIAATCEITGSLLLVVYKKKKKRKERKEKASFTLSSPGYEFSLQCSPPTHLLPSTPCLVHRLLSTLLTDIANLLNKLRHVLKYRLKTWLSTALPDHVDTAAPQSVQGEPVIHDPTGLELETGHL